jgi:hypothetical protein
MPSEDDLRDLFASASAPHAPHSIDAERVIARSRRRRLPRQLAAGTVGVLAIAGISVVGLQSIQLAPPSSSITSQETAAGAAPAEDSTIKRAPAEKLNLCTSALAEVAPSPLGLQLDVTFPQSAPVGTAPVEATVLLTNTSAVPISGTTGPSPALTLSQDGIVLWHSNGAVAASAVLVNLAPGESLEYAASFVPVRCEVDDDLAESFREGLPALPPGAYELSAALDFLPDALPTDGSTPGLDLVTGPRSTIILQ